MSPLFAEISTGLAAVMTVTAGIIGPAVMWLASQWWKWRAEKGKDAEKHRLNAEGKEKNIADHYKDLNDRMEKQAVKQEEKAAKQQERIELLQSDLVYAIGRIRYYEGHMTSKGEDFESFDINKLSSQTARALAAGEKKDDS